MPKNQLVLSIVGALMLAIVLVLENRDILWSIPALQNSHSPNRNVLAAGVLVLGFGITMLAVTLIPNKPLKWLWILLFTFCLGFAVAYRELTYGSFALESGKALWRGANFYNAGDYLAAMFRPWPLLMMLLFSLGAALFSPRWLLLRSAHTRSLSFGSISLCLIIIAYIVLTLVVGIVAGAQGFTFAPNPVRALSSFILTPFLTQL